MRDKNLALLHNFDQFNPELPYSNFYTAPLEVTQVVQLGTSQVTYGGTQNHLRAQLKYWSLRLPKVVHTNLPEFYFAINLSKNYPVFSRLYEKLTFHELLAL